MSRFTATDLPITGLKLVTRQNLCDSRGFLSRLFCADELAIVGWHKPISQINHTQTIKCGTVRGMHYQNPPYTEMKLVTCIRGEVWDVAVDLRTGSPTFLHWHAEILSARNSKSLLIPEGFAHGFQTLTDKAELLYCHSTAYCSDAEAGLNVRDPRMAINWPRPISEQSSRDCSFPFIKNDFIGVSP